MPQASPFDFSGAMATPGSMPPPPPRDMASASKSSNGRVRKPSTKAIAATSVGGANAKDVGSMPPPPTKEEKRLSEGSILELFEQLDAEQQRKHLADTNADQRRTSVPAALVRANIPSSDLPTPASLANMNVSLTEASSAQSGHSAQSRMSGVSADGNSPFNQLSPLHLSDILTAL